MNDSTRSSESSTSSRGERARPIDNGLIDKAAARRTYAGYLARQRREIERIRGDGASDLPLPADLDYFGLEGLTREAAERLAEVRPMSTGQAARIPGITPAALMTVWAHARKLAWDPPGGAGLGRCALGLGAIDDLVEQGTHRGRTCRRSAGAIPGERAAVRRAGTDHLGREAQRVALGPTLEGHRDATAERAEPGSCGRRRRGSRG